MSAERKERLVKFDGDDAAEDDTLSTNDDSELETPERALKSRKFSGPLRDLFHSVLDLIDASKLPFTKADVKREKDALVDFIWWLFDSHGNDVASDDIESDAGGSDDESTARSSDFEDDSSDSDDDGGEDSDDENSADADSKSSDKEYVPKKRQRKNE